jgi:DNA repair exonuclease SbcCD ATPase subunit
MIREIKISSYQSLKDVKVRLGKFTVITGRTGAGKSGFIRAVKMLVFNARGTSYITRGEKTCLVSASGEDGDNDWQVIIQRGGKDQYQLAVDLEPLVYTKLAGKVPEAVSGTLGLGEINFASQFDRPYLLDSSGGDVARVLGRLTNVTVLFRAAQEANRRRLQVSGELKTRQADLAALQEQAQQYATLGAEREAVDAAEASMGALAVLSQRREHLVQLLDALGQANQALSFIKVVPEPPSLEELTDLLARRDHLTRLLAGISSSEQALRQERARESLTAAGEEVCRQNLDVYIGQWGVCETCGQPVQREHAHEGEGK